MCGVLRLVHHEAQDQGVEVAGKYHQAVTPEGSIHPNVVFDHVFLLPPRCVRVNSGFEQSKVESFYRMKSILKIDKPKTVIVDMSQEEHDKSYVKVMSHPKFKESIEKFEYLLENKKEEEIMAMKEFDLENLEKLYLLNYCAKNRCKIIFAQKPEEFYNQLEQNYTDLVKQGIYPQKTS